MKPMDARQARAVWLRIDVRRGARRPSRGYRMVVLPASILASARAPVAVLVRRTLMLVPLLLATVAVQPGVRARLSTLKRWLPATVVTRTRRQPAAPIWLEKVMPLAVGPSSAKSHRATSAGGLGIGRGVAPPWAASAAPGAPSAAVLNPRASAGSRERRRIICCGP